MANKAFEIQNSTLRLGGVDLQAGNTSIVIPGVTQAATYRVDEVNETSGNNPDIFGNTIENITVIDYFRYLYISGSVSANLNLLAEYSVNEIDDGKIEEINVDTEGTFTVGESSIIESNNMWATTALDPFTVFNSEDWIQIPFRPKMRAGEVENIGGGASGVVERSIEFPQGEEGDTSGTLALIPNGNLFICTTDWSDYSDYGGEYSGLETFGEYLPGQTGFVSNVATILLADLPEQLLYILQNIEAVPGDWSIAMEDEEFGGEYTCTDVAFDVNGNVGFYWPYRNGTDPNSIPAGSGFTVSYNGPSPQPAIWKKVDVGSLGNLEVQFGSEIVNGDGDITLNADTDVLLEAGDDIRLTADDQVRIRTRGDTVNIITNFESPGDSDHVWEFGSNGHLTFPDGSVQVTAYTGTDTGGDSKIWIETFESDSPVTDRVQGATSVEYDADGNIIALFNHYTGNPGPGSYTSVAKLTPTGAILWERRFAANVETDGWGMAYDIVNNYVYVAGKTSGEPLAYSHATLTKLDGVDGTIMWNKTYDFEDDATSAVVDVDIDGNPIMVGYAFTGTDDCILTTKVDGTDGSVMWSRSINGQGSDQAYGMAVGPAGEIVTVGYIDQLGTGATDAAGELYADPVNNPNWAVNQNNVVNGSGIQFDITFTDGVATFTEIIDTGGARTVDDTVATILGSVLGGTDGLDDMVIKVATVAANDTNNRMIVVKYSANGTIAWQKVIQFDAGYDCFGADADIDVDGNIYVCGSYTIDLNPGNMSAMCLTKFDSAGDKIWNRRVVGACETFATSVVVGDDDYLYLSGITQTANQSDYIWVVAKYDNTGTVVWQRLIDNTTTWSYAGAFWSNLGGGSNIAVRNGYMVLAGGFGDPGPTPPTATIIQLDTNATPFSVGDWDIKGASFSGTLNDSASDIVVVDASKESASVSLIVTDFTTSTESGPFLTITRYGTNTSTSGLGTITVPAITGVDYKGFRASYGRVYNNTRPTELNVSKIVIHRPVYTTVTIDSSSERDDFKVTGLGDSDVVAMFILYGDTNDAKPESALRAFTEAVIDNVILVNGIEGDINTLSDQHDNFNDPTIIETLTTAADGLFTNFLFYETEVGSINGGGTTVREGSGATFDITFSEPSTLATITATDLGTASTQGSIILNADNIVTPGGWGNWLVFPDGALRVTMESLFTMNQVIPVTWAAGSTLLTGFIMIQFPGDGTFQITPVEEGGGNAVAGTWYVDVNLNSGSATFSVLVAAGGANYRVGHKIKVPYSAVGGSTDDNDVVITVDSIDDSSTGVITAITAEQTTRTSGIYTEVAGTNYNVGSEFAVYSVSQNNDSTLNIGINSYGNNYVVGDVITLPGTNLTGGASPLNDFTFTVVALSGGSVSEWIVSGTLPTIWRTNSISDGGRDQYDTANYITTNLLSEIDYNNGEIVEDGSNAFGVGSSYSFVYQPGIFGLLVVNNLATFISTEGNSGADGNSVTDTGNLYYPGTPGASYDNAVRYLNIVNNPTIEFVKQNYGDQVDVLIADNGNGSGVAITRGNNQGIYNPYREEGWNSGVSPAGTEWNIDGWTDLSDITSRTYNNLYATFGGNENLGNEIVGTECVMYVPDSDKYYAVKFSTWTQGNQGGGFAYTRRELDTADPTRADGIRFSDGTVQTTAATPATRVKLSSPGARRIEDVSGYKSVSVIETGLFNISSTTSRASENTNVIWINATTTTIDEIVNDERNVNNSIYTESSLEFSLDSINWYTYAYNGWTTDSNERGYEINSAVTYSQGDTVYFRYRISPVSAIWWDKNLLPGSGTDFRGAVIDYHAYTGDATFIGTIHIVDDNGDEHITHTEVASGSTSSENDNLWLVNNEGTISYQRTDGQSRTVKVQWTARVFYGSEIYD